MCGLAGFLATNKFESTNARLQLQKMCDAIIHRGPDAEGQFICQHNILAMGHRRLSILDLSDNGAQPMSSQSGRWTIAFNGEIYNHLDLRIKLNRDSEEKKWNGHSDTETFLECVEEWGIKKTLSLCVGMFSLALWDNKKSELTLARDRFGEKPLYYGKAKTKDNTFFLFGSDLNAIKQFDYFNSDIDRNVLREYMRFGYIDDGRSIFKNIKKVEPATFIRISYKTHQIKIESYWSMQDHIKKRVKNSQKNSYKSAVEIIHQRLRKSVQSQTISDVPIGCFLSGGIDSSLIAALLQENSATPINTFSIGFNEAEYNEAEYAKDVAEHLGTNHTELYISPSEIREIIPKMSYVYSEPFADSSQLPTYLLCSLASKHVKVALSGDAGDEIFCGYNRYRIGQSVWPKIRRLPHSIRKQFGQILINTKPSIWDKFSSISNQSRLGEKMHKLGSVIGSKDIHELYENICTEWSSTESIVLNSNDLGRSEQGLKVKSELIGAEYMMFSDLFSYLPGDILTKVDRASMAHSLETRAPFLDHRLVEEAWKLPLEHKIRNGQSKSILRDILVQYVPKHLTDRPKMGFAIPIGAWLRTELREWAEDLLSVHRLSTDGFLDVKMVRKIWDEHLSKRFNHEKKLWSILMFQSWLAQQNL